MEMKQASLPDGCTDEAAWKSRLLKTEKETQNNNIKTQLKDFKEKYMV